MPHVTIGAFVDRQLEVGIDDLLLVFDHLRFVFRTIAIFTAACARTRVLFGLITAWHRWCKYDLFVTLTVHGLST